MVEGRIAEWDADARGADQGVVFGNRDIDMIETSVYVRRHGELQDVSAAEQGDDLIQCIGQQGGSRREHEAARLLGEGVDVHPPLVVRKIGRGEGKDRNGVEHGFGAKLGPGDGVFAVAAAGEDQQNATAGKLIELAHEQCHGVVQAEGLTAGRFVRGAVSE